MALIIDSIYVMGVALGTIISNSLGHRGTTRNVEFYKNFAESLNCDAEPIQVWRHGSDVMKSLREVGFLFTFRGIMRIIIIYVDRIMRIIIIYGDRIMGIIIIYVDRCIFATRCQMTFNGLIDASSNFGQRRYVNG